VTDTEHSTTSSSNEEELVVAVTARDRFELVGCLTYQVFF